MADYERTVLDFYQLPTAYPSEWPAEKDRGDSSDEERDDKVNKLQNRKSRYQALERAVSGRRSVIPGSEGDQEGGLGNLVQKDEPDPLGTADSVVRALRLQGLSLQDDARLRMLSHR
jgi:exocyst complex component 2